MKYLFCPLASHGFVYPLMGIAQAMRCRGHDVAFVTGRAFNDALACEGIERIPRGPGDGDSFEVNLWTRAFSVAIQVKHLEYAIQRFAPDLLVTTQLTLGPLIAAEQHELPVAVVGLAAYLWPLWQPDRPPESPAEERIAWRYADMLKNYNEARAVHGLQARAAHYLDNPFLGDLYLLQSIPDLEANQYPLPAQVRFVGSCLWEPTESDPELSRWLKDRHSAGKSIIYAQPGRTFGRTGFWPHLIAALKGASVQVAACVGRMDNDSGEVPSNFYVREYIAQGQVLPYARAVISSGHTASVLGAATNGLPSLLLPQGSGSEDIAERFQAYGAALCLLHDEVHEGSLRFAINKLFTDSKLRAAAVSLQRGFSRFGGCETAAALLEELAESRLQTRAAG